MASPEPTEECILCHQYITYAVYFSGNCPRSDRLQGLGHVTKSRGGPRLTYPTIKEQT